MLFRMHFYQLPLQIHVAVSSTSLIHVTCVGLHLLRSDHVVQKDIQSSVEMETTNWILVPCRLMPDSSPWPISCQRQRHGSFHSHGGTPIAGWFIENPKHKWLITAGTPITKRKAPWEYHLMNIWLVVWNMNGL